MITIDGDRLWSSLMELARIGAYHDEATGLVGVNRQSLTDEDAEGRREGAEPDLAPVMAAFTEEEGVRFGTDMLGSAVAASRLTSVVTGVKATTLTRLAE